MHPTSRLVLLAALLLPLGVLAAVTVVGPWAWLAGLGLLLLLVVFDTLRTWERSRRLTLELEAPVPA